MHLPLSQQRSESRLGPVPVNIAGEVTPHRARIGGPPFPARHVPRREFETPEERPVAPVFIVGAPRSGTSIFTWCLGQHPNILVQEESNWLGNFADHLQACYVTGSSRGPRSQLSAMGINRERFFQQMGTAVDQLIRSHRPRYEHLSVQEQIRCPKPDNAAFRVSRSPGEPKSRWVDGTPENSFFISGLRHLYPAAKFLHLVRDVESVVKSLLTFSHYTVGSEADAYRYWLRVVQACVVAEQTFGSDVVMRVRYRDLIDNPEATLRKCCEFLGEPFSSAVLEPLGTRINSSSVPSSFDPTDPHTDPELRKTARDLSREVLADGHVCFPSNAAQAAILEQRFVSRARYLARMEVELNNALDSLALAERELARLRGATSDEGARELARTRTPYDARIIVAVPVGGMVPSLSAREPLPVSFDAGSPITPEADAELTERFQAVSREAGFALLPQRLLDSFAHRPQLRQFVESCCRPLCEYSEWSLFAF